MFGRREDPLQVNARPGTERASAPAGRGVILCLLLTAAAFVLRAHHLAATDLEGYEERAARLTSASYSELARNAIEQPPLNAMAQKAVMSMTGGTGPHDIRLSSAIAGALTVTILFLFGARVGGLPLAATAAALLCVSHFHIACSRDGRWYALLTLLATLFLWTWWEVTVRRHTWMMLIALPAAAALVLTHRAGLLVIASGLAATPLALLPPAKEPDGTRKARASLGTYALLLGMIGVAYPYWGSYTGNIWNTATAAGGLAPLPVGIDVSPTFLLSQLAAAMALPDPYVCGAMALMALGGAALLIRQLGMALLTAAVLSVPVALVWIARPPFFWRPEHFLFMLPFALLLAAAGLVALGLPALRSRGWTSLVCLAGLSVFAAPNLAAAYRYHANPVNHRQQAAALLTDWVRPQDYVVCAPEGCRRVMDYYWHLATAPERIVDLEPDQIAAWTVSVAPRTWFLCANEAVREATAFTLSSKVSRVALPGLWMAFGPNTQQIVFGENAPGAPDAGGALTIDAGEEGIIEILVPRAGRRAVFVETEGTGQGPLRLRLPEREPLSLEAAGDLHWGVAEIPFGRATLTVANGGAGTARIRSIEIVPAVEQGTLSVPAWDFQSLQAKGGSPAAMVERIDGHLLLRGLNAGDTLYYRVLCAQPGAVRLRLAALNDPPGANRFSVSVPGVTQDAFALSFDLADGSVSALDTAPISLERGIYTIAVRYEGLDDEQKRALTDDFTVTTPERMQECGLEFVEVVPAGL